MRMLPFQSRLGYTGRWRLAAIHRNNIRLTIADSDYRFIRATHSFWRIGSPLYAAPSAAYAIYIFTNPISLIRIVRAVKYIVCAKISCRESIAARQLWKFIALSTNGFRSVLLCPNGAIGVTATAKAFTVKWTFHKRSIRALRQLSISKLVSTKTFGGCPS